MPEQDDDLNWSDLKKYTIPAALAAGTGYFLPVTARYTKAGLRGMLAGKKPSMEQTAAYVADHLDMSRAAGANPIVRKRLRKEPLNQHMREFLKQDNSRSALEHWLREVHHVEPSPKNLMDVLARYDKRLTDPVTAPGALKEFQDNPKSLYRQLYGQIRNERRMVKDPAKVENLEAWANYYERELKKKYKATSLKELQAAIQSRRAQGKPFSYTQGTLDLIDASRQDARVLRKYQDARKLLLDEVEASGMNPVQFLRHVSRGGEVQNPAAMRKLLGRLHASQAPRTSNFKQNPMAQGALANNLAFMGSAGTLGGMAYHDLQDPAE